MLGQFKDFFTGMLFKICGIEGEKKEKKKKNPREEFIQIVGSM